MVVDASFFGGASVRYQSGLVLEMFVLRVSQTVDSCVVATAIPVHCPPPSLPEKKERTK